MAPTTRLAALGFKVGIALLISILAACGSDDDPTDQDVRQARLYVFGDSLSDTGNLGRPLSFGDDLPAPFFNNRISNGPVVVDYVAQSLGAAVEPSNYLSPGEDGTNYAIAGAKAESEPPDLDLGRQLDSFFRNNPGPLNDQDLFLIFIGGNDVLDSAGTETADLVVSRAVAAISAGLNRLADQGARRFLVFNLPNIGATPKVLNESGTSGIDQSASALTESFNTQLASVVTTFQARTPQTRLIDIFASLNRILASAEALGFENTTQACYDTNELRFFAYCNDQLLDRFIFFDDIHPSGRTHRLIAEQILEQLP